MIQEKEKQFLELFDTHVDGLFSHCVKHISDRARAFELIESAFKRTWDQIARGKEPRVEELYRAVDELITKAVTSRDLKYRTEAAFS